MFVNLFGCLSVKNLSNCLLVISFLFFFFEIYLTCTVISQEVKVEKSCSYKKVAVSLLERNSAFYRSLQKSSPMCKYVNSIFMTMSASLVRFVEIYIYGRK